MITEDIEILLSNDLKACKSNSISDILLQDIDNILLDRKNEISNEVILIYKKFAPIKKETPDNMTFELFNAMKNYMKEMYSNNNYLDALLIARFLIVKSKLAPVLYVDIADILLKLNNKELAHEFIKIYKTKETNKPLGLLTIANFYNIGLEDYKTAIKYYEKYLLIDETKAVIYTIVGSLYAKAYGDFSIKDQIYYYERAYKLQPHDKLILFSLALAYEKYENKDMANKYYSELIQNNPTDADFYNYGAFLISCGELKKGHEYLTHRFNIKNNINLKYPIPEKFAKKWDFKTDISQKTLLVHYEQGFGDTILYCRFLPQLKKILGKIIFVVQDKLYDLMKNSPIISDGIDIISNNTDISTIEYDYDMALLDTPYVLGIDKNNIPYANGYLTVSEDKIKKYGNLNIKKSENLKIGIAYKGNTTANYQGRDLDISRFENILNISGIDFYSFSMTNEIRNNKITPLAETFDSFTDTACAIKNMDIIISTDNVILNLAGALGVKTFGLFNKQPNFRWFQLKGENVGWYNSVKALQVETKDYWFPVLEKLFKILSE